MTVAYKARYLYYTSHDNFSETYQSAIQRIQAANLSKDFLLIIDAVYTMARLLFLNGSFYESLDYFLLYKEMNLNSEQRAKLFYSLAQLYSMINDDHYEMAEHYYDLAESETQTLGFTNNALKANILFGRANLYVNYSDAYIYEYQNT